MLEAFLLHTVIYSLYAQIYTYALIAWVPNITLQQILIPIIYVRHRVFAYEILFRIRYRTFPQISGLFLLQGSFLSYYTFLVSQY